VNLTWSKVWDAGHASFERLQTAAVTVIVLVWIGKVGVAEGVVTYIILSAVSLVGCVSTSVLADRCREREDQQGPVWRLNEK
jgi:hypothetical protein